MARISKGFIKPLDNANRHLLAAHENGFTQRFLDQITDDSPVWTIDFNPRPFSVRKVFICVYSRPLLRLAVRSRSRFLLGSIQSFRCHCSRFMVTGEPIVPYRGGRITDDGGEGLGVEATVELWAKTDRCRDCIEIPILDGSAHDGCYPQCFESRQRWNRRCSLPNHWGWAHLAGKPA